MKSYFGENRQFNDLDGEVWNDIPMYDGVYMASNLGRIKSVERIDCKGRRLRSIIRAQGLNSSGQYCLPLHNEGICRSFSVSQLVYFAFNGMKPDDSLKIAHINKDKRDNRLDNLELQTQEKVCRDSFRLGISHDWGIAQFSKLQTDNIYAEFDTDEDHRICTRCLTEKHITSFYKRKDAPSGRNRICGDCLLLKDGIKDVGRNRFLLELKERNLKRCSRCGDIKRVDMFPNRSKGIGHYCTSCESQKNKGVVDGRNKLRSEGVKHCKRCGMDKILSEFHCHNGNVACYCKDCTRNINMSQWQKRKAMGLKK